MKIAVIGTGNIGAAYARALARAKYEVVIGDRNAHKATALASDIGAHASGGTIAAALASADVAVLALPYQAITAVLAEAAPLTGKILVDVSNPLSADFQDLVVGFNTSAGEQIQAAAPGARVVKAFNTVFAGLVSAEARAGQQLQVLVAGDDAAATKQVRDIAQALGFAPVDAGPLRNSRYLEPIGMMNIQFGFFLGVGPTTAPSWAHGSNK